MADQDVPRKASRRMRWVLGVSLALNLVFIGFFAGAALRFGGERGPQAKDRLTADVRGYATPYLRAMPREMRREMTRSLRAGGKAGMLSRETRRAAYAQMIEALRAQPFDPGTVRRILDGQGAATLALQSAAQDAWLAQISQMSEADRAAYALRLEELLARRGKRGVKPPKN